MASKLTLEELVTSAATSLMGVNALTLRTASEELLQQLVGYFEVDLSFLRRNDHILGATVLVAEWPPRPEFPVPDPLGVIYFAGADPRSRALEHLSSVLTTRPTLDEVPGPGPAGLRRSGRVVLATVPLLASEATTGTLGSSSSATGNGTTTRSTRCRRWPRCWPNCRPGSPPKSGCVPGLPRRADRPSPTAAG